jgi:hypothetical protein
MGEPAYGDTKYGADDVMRGADRTAHLVTGADTHSGTYSGTGAGYGYGGHGGGA